MQVIDLVALDRPPIANGASWRARMVQRVLAQLPPILSDLVSAVRIARKVDRAMADILRATHGVDADGTDIYGYLCEEPTQTYSVQLYWDPVLNPEHLDWWALRWGVENPSLLSVPERLEIILLDLFAELARRLELPCLEETLREQAYVLIGGRQGAQPGGRGQGTSAASPAWVDGDGTSDRAPESLPDGRAIDWDAAFREFFGDSRGQLDEDAL